MQNCLYKLNLINCLIYLDNIIVYSRTAEEHLHRLCVVFDQFREYSLKLKPSKWSFFKKEINYLAHWVFKKGVQPSDSNLKAIVECALPQTYMEIQAFLRLAGHYRQLINGFACITQPLNGFLFREGLVEIGMDVTTGRHLESLQCSETGVHECPSPSLFWLYQRIPTRNQCI